MNKSELTGLVVCGGASTRMGMDKGLLRYFDREQRYHVADMLSSFCSQVYLSLNATQTDTQNRYPILRDQSEWSDIGPLGALLTAFNSLRRTSFLMMGCDYPLLTVAELERFVASIDNQDVPKVFFNEADGFYEPLLGFYPASVAYTILDYHRQGQSSLQRILKSICCEKYLPENKDSILSVDDRKGYETALKKISGKKE